MIAGKFSFSTLCLEHLFASRGETRKEGQNGEKRGTSFARMRNRQTNWKIRLSGAERIRGNACHGDLIARWPRNFVRNVPPAVPPPATLAMNARQRECSGIITRTSQVVRVNRFADVNEILRSPAIPNFISPVRM